MTKIEKIQDLLGSVEADVRKSAIKDVLFELREGLKTCAEDERAGFRAAIETIESNF
jgi:hypothetical protein